MNLTPDIVLPDQIWSQIFKYINPKTLMKLRNVNVELMYLIEKFGGWKSLFFDSSTLVPWRNQLCEMYDPKLTKNEYDSQPDGFYKKLIAFYILWKSLGNAEESQKLPLTSKEDGKFYSYEKYDSYGNFLAYISMSSTVYIINVNTLKLIADPLNIESLNINSSRVIAIKIWQPHSSDSGDQTYLLKRKLFLIVQCHQSMLIWDVDEKVSIPVPEILQEIYRYPENPSSQVKHLFRYENDIFVNRFHDLQSKFEVVKLAWNQREEKITGRIIFRKLNAPDVFVYSMRFNMYIENQKLMLVFNGSKMFYFAQVDIPKVNDPPRIMTLTENSTEFKQIFTDFQGKMYMTKVRINNSYVVTAYDDNNFYVALKKETQDGGYDFVTKSIYGFDRRFQISHCIFKFDVLFILTTEGDLEIYTFKNSNHLMDIDLFTDKAKVIATGIGSDPEVRLIAKENIPHAIIFSWPTNLMFVTL